MLRKLHIALAACASVLLAAGTLPPQIAHAEQLKGKTKKKNMGLLVPAIQKVRDPASSDAVKKDGIAKARIRSGAR